MPLVLVQAGSGRRSKDGFPREVPLWLSLPLQSGSAESDADQIETGRRFRF